MTDRQPIVYLAGRGDGATADGRFVSGVAPGDVVTFDGDSIEIEPGPHHVAPPCRHFPECGGCQLQQVDDTAYRAWVADRILRGLAAQRIEPIEVRPTHLSPPRTRRRASLRAVRRGGRVTLGFNAEASHNIIDMHECHILEPSLFALVAPLRALLPALVREGQASGVTLTASDTGIDLLLSNVDVEGLSAIEMLTSFAHTHDLARLSIETAAGVDVIAEARQPQVRFGNLSVTLPPAPFLQATRDGEAALQQAVVEAIGDAKRCADLFCGLGTFALPLTAQAAVHAVDAAGPAVRSLETAAKQAKRRLSVEHRDLFRRPLRADELKRFDAVVFDPPRAGAKEQVAELARAGVGTIVAVSCNPNTFARDAAMLVKGGYRLQRLWPIGQFRWSTHVELVAEFRC